MTVKSSKLVSLGQNQWINKPKFILDNRKRSSSLLFQGRRHPHFLAHGSILHHSVFSGLHLCSYIFLCCSNSCLPSCGYVGHLLIIQDHLFISNLPSSLCQVSYHTHKFWTLGLLTLLVVIILVIPEIENCVLWTRFGLSPLYGNKTLLEHSNSQPSHTLHDCFHTSKAALGYTRGHLATKHKIFSVVLLDKNFWLCNQSHCHPEQVT